MSQGKLVAILFGIAVVALIAFKPGSGLLLTAASDGVAHVANDDPRMLAAFKQARDSLDEFLKTADAPPPDTDSFAVKVAIAEGDQREYFWISPFSHQGDAFTGRINNTPRLVSHVQEGQEIKFDRSEVVDWTYQNTRENKVYGNFTVCVLLADASERELAEFKSAYGVDCDR